MKSWVLNLLRRVLPLWAKQYAKRVLGLPSSRMHDAWDILATLPALPEEHVVLDLGARNGWFLQCWKDYAPKAVVHAFEPDEAAYKRLEKRYSTDESVYLSEKGIGAGESLETFYHFAGSEVSSSFLKPNQSVWDEIQYQTGVVEERMLEITTLDAYCEQLNIKSVFLIKIDIQGYELEALRGSLAVLSRTDYLLVESSIKPLYENAANFTEVHQFMVDQGFHMMDFRAWHRGNRVLIESDMLFRRNDLAPSIDGNYPEEREYI